MIIKYVVTGMAIRSFHAKLRAVWVGCPGQCKDVQSRPPFAITDDIFIPFRYDLRKNIKRILYVLIILVILSTTLNVRKRK